MTNTCTCLLLASHPYTLLSVRPEGRFRAGGSSIKYCNYYLRGYCPFTNCRFAHASVDSVPDSALETAVVSELSV